MELSDILQIISTGVTSIAGLFLYYQTKILKTEKEVLKTEREVRQRDIASMKETLALFDVGKLKEAIELKESAYKDKAFMDANKEVWKRVQEEFMPTITNIQETNRDLSENILKERKEFLEKEVEFLKKLNELIWFVAVVAYGIEESGREEFLSQMLPKNQERIKKVIANFSPELVAKIQEEWRKSLNS